MLGRNESTQLSVTVETRERSEQNHFNAPFEITSQPIDMLFGKN
jgi:hypothetical protein